MGAAVVYSLSAVGEGRLCYGDHWGVQNMGTAVVDGLTAGGESWLREWHIGVVLQSPGCGGSDGQYGTNDNL